MKLLDAAEVLPRDDGGWERGWEGDSRVCSGIHVYLSECDPGVTADVIGTDEFNDSDCGYRVIPFGIIAEFDRRTVMSRPDDEDWLRTALRDSSEIPVSRGLLVRQTQGIQRNGDSIFSDVWIGSDDAEEVPAPDLGDPDTVAASISEGRRIFFAKTFGIQPILHVNPANAIALKRSGVLELDPVNGDDRTAWGDAVVISEGYYDIPDLSAVPVAFWTGPVRVTLSDVNKEEVIHASRQNRKRLQVSRLAAVDIPPCSIVRIGPAPAPAG